MDVLHWSGMPVQCVSRRVSDAVKLKKMDHVNYEAEVLKVCEREVARRDNSFIPPTQRAVLSLIGRSEFSERRTIAIEAPPSSG